MMAAPWNLKILFAFLSDCVPIFGQRRKPYFFGGIMLQALAWLMLGLAPPSIGLVASLGFVSTLGQVVVGTMCDTLVVENMRYEQLEEEGKLQVNCWIGLSIGSLAGTLIGGASLDYWGVTDQLMFTLVGGLKLGLVPLVVALNDPIVKTGLDDIKVEMKVKAKQVYAAMKEYRVWQPVVFIFIYAAWPGNGGAFNSFLAVCPNATETHPCSSVNVKIEDNTSGGLGFSPSQFSYVMAIAGVGGTVGTYLYKVFLMGVPWRPLFATTILIADGLSCLSLILIFRLNVAWGVPDIYFALGDDVVNNVAQQFVGMPMMILMAKICPAGIVQ
jgi:hypothetical protein